MQKKCYSLHSFVENAVVAKIIKTKYNVYRGHKDMPLRECLALMAFNAILTGMEDGGYYYKIEASVPLTFGFIFKM